MATPESMSLREAQQDVDRYISQFREGYWPPLANLARLVEEVGELARHINAVHGPKKLRGDTCPESDIEDELGDLLFSVVVLANSLGVSLDSALRNSLDKVRVRDANRWERVETGRDDERVRGGVSQPDDEA